MDIQVLKLNAYDPSRTDILIDGTKIRGFGSDFKAKTLVNGDIILNLQSTSPDNLLLQDCYSNGSQHSLDIILHITNLEGQIKATPTRKYTVVDFYTPIVGREVPHILYVLRTN